MSDENRYVYFSLTGRQMQLLLAALLRSLAKTAALGEAATAHQQEEAEEIEALHAMLDRLREKSRTFLTVILSDSQFALVSIAVKTTQLSLASNHALKREYDALASVMDARRISRRSRERPPFSAKDPAFADKANT